MNVEIKDVDIDGLPYHSKVVGRLAFIFDGEIVSGWPLNDEQGGWEANTDVGRLGVFLNVKKYIIFPIPLWEII